MYTAIISRNLRRLSAGQEMVVFRKIQTTHGEFRDHAHVELTQPILTALRHKWFGRNNGNGAVRISFDADIKVYTKRGEKCFTFEKVRDIKLLNKVNEG